ncbi:MAG: hypothetical protein CSA58_05095 [Micrococcales bacterium]|nr:MAG: hypothetical protein CSB46_09960 [Micrococcales bacterium]PIE27275.1 MAG: hypothetical protein CSA58_05095 [Micrococcales bacterium]
MFTQRVARWATAAVLLLAVTGCLWPSPPGPKEPAPSGPADRSARPQAWPPPDPHRPQVELSYRIADDLRSATGSERVLFRPDAPVCELVFRTWVNVTTDGDSNQVLAITDATVDGSARPVRMSVQDTLATVPLPRCVPAGTPVEVVLKFTLDPVPGLDERTSRTKDLAWFATAYPLLAWQRGVGWVQDRPQRVAGETVTSETFALQGLRITAASRWQVAGVGEPAEVTTDPRSGLRTHTFRAPALRDVSFTVGRLVSETVRVAGSTVHLSLPAASTRSPMASWRTTVKRQLGAISDYLGPVPYEHMWITVIPAMDTGLEMPGGAFLGDVKLRRERWLLAHELAHLWFFGLVGNNQARDPWLDEAFASFVADVVQQQADSTGENHVPRRLKGSLGQPMSYWADSRHPDKDYVNGVYAAGAQVLADARAAGPAEDFDAAVRDYLYDNAHTVAERTDVAAAFAADPAALQVLRDAGALP